MSTTTSGPMSTTSALYRGSTWHERRQPFRRSFRRRLWLAYVNLDEVASLAVRVPLISQRRWRPVQFRRSDYLVGIGDDPTPLADRVRDLVAERTGERPTGPVCMLAHLRQWGWCFNPLTLYYCHDTGGVLRWVVAEVTNTPWKERHAYVLPAAADGVHGYETDKLLHVSPFWPMQHRYRFEIPTPGEQLSVRIENLAREGAQAGEVMHVAGLSLDRSELTRPVLIRCLLRYPFLTHRVSLGIHLHAAVLIMRRARFYSHPKRRTHEAVR